MFIYSLKNGINDGFLTPFKVRQIQTTLDTYYYTPDDKVVEGEIEAGRLYEEADFNRSIEIRERERKRVEIFMSQIDQNEKTLVFCATQSHALLVRDLSTRSRRAKTRAIASASPPTMANSGSNTCAISRTTRRPLPPSSPRHRSFRPAWTLGTYATSY